MTTGEAAPAVDGAATTALESACDHVRDAGETDAVDGVQPVLVVAPRTTDEVSAVMRVSHEHALSVVVRGRGTKTTWGRAPSRADLVLDLAALDQVLDHAAGDLIVEAQAGTRLADLQEVVGAARQRLAVDETVPGASVGGTLVTGTSGPGRLAVGSLRDLLIGVTVVRADGVVAKAGGRVVKNVAGYDLGKLAHGSYGTLAVVTQAVFRLHPRPAARLFVGLPVESPAEAQRLAQLVLHSQVVPGGLEVDLPPAGPGTLTVLLEGIAEGVRGRTETTLGLLGSSCAVSDSPAPGWAQLPWDVRAQGDARATALKATFALSGLEHVLTVARDAPAPVHVRGSAGVGVVHAAIPAGTDPDVVAACVARLRRACHAQGGSLVVLDAPAAVKEVVDSWGPVPALDLMRRVKDQFDPDHRLAPGRFVGGI